MTDSINKQLVDAGVLAGILGTSPTIVSGMDLPHYKVGKRGVRYDVGEVLDALRVPNRINDIAPARIISTGVDELDSRARREGGAA